MANRSSVVQRTQIGAESTPGTIVPATKRLPNLMIAPYPDIATKEFRGQGIKYPSVVVPSKDFTTFSYSGDASYAELAYIFASLMGTTTPVSVGTGGYLYAFGHSTILPDTPQTYSFEHGDPNFGFKFPYGIFSDCTIAATRDEVKVSGSGFGQQTTDSITLTSANTQQTLTMTGIPTGGTFTLTCQGAATAPIPYSATSTQVAAALSALPTIGYGVVTATGGPLPGTPVVVTFAGDLASQSVTLMTATSSGLTGGTSPTMTPTMTTAGSPTVVEDVPVLPNTVTVTVDSTFAAIGTTALTGDFSATLALTGRWGQAWPLNGSYASWGFPVELVPKASLKLEIHADAQNSAFLTQIRAAGIKYLQLKFLGPQISSGVFYQFVINVPFMLSKSNALKDLAGVYVADWDLQPIADQTAGYALQASVQCKTAGL